MWSIITKHCRLPTYLGGVDFPGTDNVTDVLLSFHRAYICKVKLDASCHSNKLNGPRERTNKSSVWRHGARQCKAHRACAFR